MATVEDIINSALRKLGNHNPSSNEQDIARTTLNFMIDTMAQDNMFVPYVSRENFTLTSGQNTYTIGSGGTLNTARPIRIDNGFIRSTTNIDYPLNIITPESYNSIPLKNISTLPQNLYFLPEYPLAKLIFDYAPTATFLSLYLDLIKYLTNFATISETVNLPAGYMKMLIYNLAVELESEYGIDLPRSVYIIAEDSKNMCERGKMWKPETINFDSSVISGKGNNYIIERGF